MQDDAGLIAALSGAKPPSSMRAPPPPCASSSTARRPTAAATCAPSNLAALRRLAAEAGVGVRGRLYSDALSPPNGPAPTYEAMSRHNVELLVPAMRGDDS